MCVSSLANCKLERTLEFEHTAKARRAKKAKKTKLLLRSTTSSCGFGERAITFHQTNHLSNPPLTSSPRLAVCIPMTDAVAVVDPVATESAVAASSHVELETSLVLLEQDTTNSDDTRKYQERSLMDNDTEDDENDEKNDDNDSKNDTMDQAPVANDDSFAAATLLVSHTNNNETREIQLAVPPLASSSVASLFQNSVTRSILHHRHSSAIAATTTTPTIISTFPLQPTQQQQQYRWDGFVRRGTRLKTLVEDAMAEVTTTMTAKKKRSRSNNDSEEPQRRIVQVADFTAELAREKMTEIFQLQRQLNDAKAQASAMQAANAALREENASHQSRYDRTVDALRLAGSNAAKARADADAAEATAATLSQTLQSLQTVITETKRASQILHQEQQQVSAAAASVEAKLLQKEGDLARVHKELQTLRLSNAALEHSHDQWKEERSLREQSIQQKEQELQQLKREKLEQTAVEQARKVRADKIEQEWRRAQAMLVEATSGQEAAEQTQAVLEETIESLQKANRELHQTLKETQDAARSDNGRLNDVLSKAEKEAQQLRIAAEAANEEMQRLKQDKASADKQIQQLKVRLAKVERDLAVSNAHAVATGSSSNNNNNNKTVSPESVSPIGDSSITSALTFRLPPLASARDSNKTDSLTTTTTNPAALNVTDKENAGVKNGTHCCMCIKPSIGIMKTCQCGDSSCKKRAHSHCVKHIQPGPSVSHPGTPSVPLPIVLCSSVAAKLAMRRVDD